MQRIKNWSDYRYYSKLYPTSSVSLENFLIEKLTTKDREIALEEIIKNNISTVHHYSLKYRWSNIAYEDLVQYGVAGIISAADNFDTTKNVRFFTFCTHYIIGRIKRALEQHNNRIRIPAHVNLALLRIQNVDPNVDISDEELSKLTTDRYKLHHLRIALEAKKQKMVDIDELFDLSDSNNNVIDRKLVIEAMMSILHEKEQIALQLKFGLNNNRIHTMAEIDKIIGTDTEYLLIGVYRKLRQKFDGNVILELLRDE